MPKDCALLLSPHSDQHAGSGPLCAVHSPAKSLHASHYWGGTVDARTTEDRRGIDSEGTWDATADVAVAVIIMPCVLPVLRVRAKPARKSYPHVG